MDVNFIRTAVTMIGLLLFIGLVAWVWWPGRRDAFDEAARAPFDGEAEAGHE